MKHTYQMDSIERRLATYTEDDNRIGTQLFNDITIAIMNPISDQLLNEIGLQHNLGDDDDSTE